MKISTLACMIVKDYQFSSGKTPCTNTPARDVNIHKYLSGLWDCKYRDQVWTIALVLSATYWGKQSLVNNSF